MSYSYPHYTQMTAAELAAKASASAARARKKGLKYEPIEVTAPGRQICTTWWGQEWCANLERYADYANRIDRGKRYVRNGSVLDLKIEKGKVHALVQGSRVKPYKVEIEIQPLSAARMEEILALCTRKISSLEDLAAGRFPEELKSIFTAKGGLFPSPAQIRFHCSCPDWASMCKHVAAVMYGIGVRLDENPFYFFELRGIDASSLIRQSVENKVEAMLKNANRPSFRILSDEQIPALFGLDMEE